MVNVITQLFKYMVALIMAIYTIRCFTVFSVKKEKKKRRIYRSQNFLMLWIHLMLYTIIFLNEKSMYVLVFYGAQLCFFIVALFMYNNIYRNASKLLINNMFFLMMIGFVMLTRLDMTLAVKQFLIAVASVAFSLTVPVIVEKVGFLSRLGIVYGIIGLGVVGSVFIFGTKVYGATNWISIAGIGFQPSELAKIIFVFFVAALLARSVQFVDVVKVSVAAAAHVLILVVQKDLGAAMLYKNTSLKQIMLTSALAGVHVLMLVVEKDLGAAVIFFVTYIVMLYVATRRAMWPLMGLAAGAGASVVAYHLFDHVKRRVVAWKDPWGNYNDAGYQIAQSLFAIGTGGWFGMGLYQGMPKDIPVRESDFIFAVIAEELGGFFAICLILVFMSCFIMFINISLRLTNNFYKLLAIGLSIAYGFQLFLCIGGVIKFIPHTGVTLPLISYGGSSILSTIIVFAVIQGLYLLKQKEVKEIEEKRRESEQRQWNDQTRV